MDTLSGVPVEQSGDLTSTDGAPPPQRRLNLFDMILVVAATTPGIVLLRFANERGLFADKPRVPRDFQFIERMSVATGCVLIPLALASLALGLLDRRTPRRDIVRGAGFIACVIVWTSTTFAMAYMAVRVRTANELDRTNQINIQFNNLFGRVKYLAGPMILGAWLALAMTGRFRSPTWIDRLGILLGGCLVFTFLYQEFHHLVAPLIR